ncbi:MAG: helix-turn-helix transcriptional regulator [Alphaproteobacteria bacterium]|nr:helix-turn-helix transcriptional regulator [Alphaproteobacteria bacterium]
MKEADILKALGAKIRDFRKAAGLTQEVLAGKVGVSVDMVGNIERGENFTSALTLHRIGQAVGRNVDELWAGVPRVKKRAADAAIDQTLANIRQMLESGQAVDAQDLAAVFEKAAKRQPKAPKKR